MKNTKTIFLTAVASAILLSATIFSACTKSSNSGSSGSTYVAPNLCASVTCQNGGTCSGGNCTCPSGYTGVYCQTKATTSVQYNNNTGAQLSITINGQTQTIAAGASVNFTGTYGTTASGTASTSLNYGTNLSWNAGLTTTFPASGTQIVNINVGDTYFLLLIQNNSGDIINTVEVNYGTVAQTTETINLPANYSKSTIGFYLAYTNTDVKLVATSGSWNFPLTLPFLNNQSETLTANP